MAAPHLRVVRRPKNRALTAASQYLDDPVNSFKSSIVGSTRGDWQDEAWEMLDHVGELRYYVAWRSSSSSRCRLIASELDPATGLPTGECENNRVNDIVRAIAGGPMGQGQFLKRGVECLTVPGEYWLAIIVADTGDEQWYSLTRDEIKRTRDEVELSLPDGSVHILDPARDSLIRVWNPRTRKASEADSPVRSTLPSLREIVRTTKTISNASKSRLIGNGVVFVPQEMSLPTNNGPVAETLTSDTSVTGTPAVQALQELLFQVAQTAVDDEDSMAALIPMFASVPGEQVKNVTHLKFDNQITDIAIKTRNDAISRLAMGLDVSPERLLGLGNNSNHWTAWNITEEDVRLHIVPPVETICTALTEQVLARVLMREGIDPTKYVVWYDSGDLTADPDKTDEATAAADRGAINLEAYREFLGLGDTGYDLTTLEGWQQWAQDRVSMKPELLKDLAPLLPELGPVMDQLKPPPPPQLTPGAQNELPPSQDQQPNEQPPSEPPRGANPPAAAANLTPNSAVIELLVGRALELAGKRRRNRANKDRLAGLRPHEFHRVMEGVDPADVDVLIDGWDSALEDDMLRMLGMDADTVRSIVHQRAVAEMTRTVVDA